MANISKRVNRKGKPSFTAKVRLLGYYKTKSFPRREDAVRWARETEDAIRTGRYFTVNEAEKHTLHEAITRYLKSGYIDALKNRNKVASNLEWLNERYGERRLSEFSPALASEIRDRLLNEAASDGRTRKGRTVNKYLSTFSQLFEAIEKDWLWIETNPFKRIRRAKQAETFKGNPLDHDERQRLLRCAAQSVNANVRLMFPLALATGCRRGELLNLQWKDVKLKEEYFLLKETKNGKSRRVFITEPVLSLFKEHSKVRSLYGDLVFPGPGKPEAPVPFNLDYWWKKMRKEAALGARRFHDLRHTYGTFLAEQGASALEIKNAMGHDTLSMVLVYVHLAERSAKKTRISYASKMFSDEQVSESDQKLAN